MDVLPQPRQRASQPWFITFWILLALTLSGPIVNGIIDGGVFILEISFFVELVILFFTYRGLTSDNLVAKLAVVGLVAYLALGLLFLLLWRIGA